MCRFLVNILLVLCVALPSWGEDDVLLRIDSTFYYPDVPKEILADIAETWLHSRNDIASGWAEKHIEEDRIVFSGQPDSFHDYVRIKNIFLAAASNYLHYSFQIAIRDGVVRIWFTDFAYHMQSIYDPVFMLCEKRPKNIKNVVKPIYKPVYKFALKCYPERVASLHAALDEALKESEPLWPIFNR